MRENGEMEAGVGSPAGDAAKEVAAPGFDAFDMPITASKQGFGTQPGAGLPTLTLHA